ncbi:hypothetical protein CFC21_045668 [Triticum aestivum]|uniref:Uncharacterized protein n=2 Tax=Triticum aestivum TaxID=4565 RepID=A0A9R1JYW3_WHEAT|nr:hypothetical protein CFC21_045668 [Triticum aestivum]
MELPEGTLPFEVLPLEGEQDWRFGRAAGPGSTEEDLELGAPGLPRVAEVGLSGSDVLRFGGASSENPGISDGFHGLDLTVGELPLEGAGAVVVAADAELLGIVGPGLEIEEDRTGPGKLLCWVWVGGAEDRLVGVDDLDAGLLCAGKEGLDKGVVDLVAGIDDLEVGVDDLLAGADALPEGTDVLVAVAGPDVLVAAVGPDVLVAVAGPDVLDGVVDLDEGSADLVEGSVDLEVGVEDLGAVGPVLAGRVARALGDEGLEPLDAVVDAARPVGVEGLEELDVGPPDDVGRRVVAAEFKLFDDDVLSGCVVLDGGSG